MTDNVFSELNYNGEGRSRWLGSPDEVLKRTDGIDSAPSENELLEYPSPMIESDEAVSEIAPRKYERLDARYLYLHSRITKIGDYAFSGCVNLESIVLPDSVDFIGEGAFMHCRSVHTIELPDAITAISPYTFLGMRSLEILSFSRGVREIHLNAFFACENLEHIVYGGSEDDWKKIKFVGDKEVLHGIYITCTGDKPDEYGIDEWHKKMNDHLRESDDVSISSITGGSRKRKSDELMAELDDIIKRVIDDN